MSSIKDKLIDWVTEMENYRMPNWNDLPDIDLYMDQVTQLFEGAYAAGKRNQEDKILTKTMINNYAKDNLLFPIKNKRYTKEHIMFIQFIYQLKASLSIRDTKTVLEKLNQSVKEESIDIDQIYDQYVLLMEKQVDDFVQSLTRMLEEVDEIVAEMDDHDQVYLKQLFLIFSLVHQSNMYRRLAERLTDRLVEDSKTDNKQKD